MPRRLAARNYLLFPALLLAGCNPSWSPDGKQILFPYIRHTQEASGVACYDIESGQAVEVLPAAEERTVQGVLFGKDGKEAIVICAAEGEADAGAVMVLALPSGRIVRRFAIANQLDAPYTGFILVDGYLLYSPIAADLDGEAEQDGGEQNEARPPVGLRLLNLQDGSIARLFPDRLIAVARAGESLAYIETLRDPHGRDLGIACGWLDCANRKLMPIAALKPEDFGWQTAMASPIAFAAAAAETPRFAFIAVPGAAEPKGGTARETAGEYAIVVLDSKAGLLLKKHGRSPYWLRLLCLSADGRRLFTPELREDICGVRDIDVDTGEENFIPLVQRVSPPPQQSARTPAVLTTVGLAISTDQQKLAVSPQFRFADPPPAALYLLQLAARGAKEIKAIRLPEADKKSR